MLTQDFCKRLCPSIDPLVRLSVTLRLRSWETRIRDGLVPIVSGGDVVSVIVWERRGEVDAPAHPSATIV